MNTAGQAAAGPRSWWSKSKKARCLPRPLMASSWDWSATAAARSTRTARRTGRSPWLNQPVWTPPGITMNSTSLPTPNPAPGAATARLAFTH